MRLLLCLLLCGCAETQVFENGQCVFRTQADATNITFRTGNGTYFHADTLNHSTPTTSAYTGVGGAIGAAAAGVATAGVIFK